MGALGALMLMGVARKVMLGKTGRFVRSFASLPAPATSQPNSSGRRAQRKPRCRSGQLYFLTESPSSRTVRTTASGVSRGRKCPAMGTTRR